MSLRKTPPPPWQTQQPSLTSASKTVEPNDTWNLVFSGIQALGSIGLLAIAIYGFFFSSLATQIELDLRTQAALARQDLIDTKQHKLALEAALEADKISLRDGKKRLDALSAQIATLTDQSDRLKSQRQTLTKNILDSTRGTLVGSASDELDKYAIIARYSEALPKVLQWVDAELQYWDDYRAWLDDVLKNPAPTKKQPKHPGFEATTSWRVSWRGKHIISRLGIAIMNLNRKAGVIDPFVRDQEPSVDKSGLLEIFYSETGCTDEDAKLTGPAFVSRLVASNGLRSLLGADAASYRQQIVKRAAAGLSAKDLLVVCPQRHESPSQVSTRASVVLQNIQTVRNRLDYIFAPRVENNTK